MKKINGLAIVLAAVFASQANAQIYKCENKSGKVFYNDKPCPVYEKETQIKAVKAPKKGYVPPPFVEDIVKDESSVVVVGNDENNRDLKSSPNDTSKTGASQSSLDKNSASSLSGLGSSSGRVPYSQTSNQETKAFASQKKSSLKRVQLKVEHREY